MTLITTRITVRHDGVISAAEPLPIGEHLVQVDIEGTLLPPPPREAFDATRFPVFDMGPWPDGLSLRREDMYDDDGR